MLGQGSLTIHNATWQVNLAADPQDLVAGLGNLPNLPAFCGELFDMGQVQIIQVTTVPMLFNLDIVFLDENLIVTEVYRNVPPGYLVTSIQPALYFLEVNAGELANSNSGDQASLSVSIPALITNAAGASASGVFDSFMPLFMGLFFIGMMIILIKNSFEENGDQDHLLPDTRKRNSKSEVKKLSSVLEDGGKYRINIDRMGNLIITHSLRPGKDIFLQFESDKELVFDLLRRSERKDLDAGWPVEIPDHEPRASILDELWQATNPMPVNPTKPVIRNTSKYSDLDYLADDLEYLAYTIEDIGYRDRIDQAFLEAIKRARRR